MHGEILTHQALEALAAPFDGRDLKWKPKTITKDGTRALAVPYVSARAVMDRLDATVGADGWQDEYQLLPEGQVVCRLKVRLGGEWVVKCDVGGPSEQPDGGDRMKAAFSDALKRAAVKYGVGRYLYRLPHQWLAWDAQKHQFKEQPKMPVAIPAPASAKKDDGLETITLPQAHELVDLMKKHGVPWEDVADAYQLKRLGELPLVHFDHAKAFIVQAG